MFLEFIILGLIQGLTEFLPVSSSGHLALLEQLWGNSRQDLVFEVGVHFGSVLSIIVIYRKIICKWVSEVLRSIFTLKYNDGMNLFLLIVVSALPAAFIGVLFNTFISKAFDNILTIGVCFFVTGLILYWTEKKTVQESNASFYQLDDLSQTRKISFKHAFVIGLAQAFAILPGISRSGSTIAAGLFQKIPRETAALFSFLMSIPVILGAGLLQVKDLSHFNNDQLLVLSIAVLSSFIFGLIGLSLVLYFVKKARLDIFSKYLWALSLFCFALYFYRN